jgi:hypothetical protein
VCGGGRQSLSSVVTCAAHDGHLGLRLNLEAHVIQHQLPIGLTRVAGPQVTRADVAD